ncbi:MAG: VOC family protein [Ignisphaera sp.]|nr:VOC family protein [Ignisphaera sp.]MCX8167701.1 VOC family protein [Ignisphaera sp.]MDW8085265.1 VOC family protein [Ignisphaera sp.]
MCEELLKSVAQIAIVVKDLNKAIDSWSRILGVKPSRVTETDRWEETKMQFMGSPSRGRARLAFFNLNNIVIELIEPIDGPSTWREFLEKHGQGIHHIAFDVRERSECIDRFIGAGSYIQQTGMFRGGRYTYIDARETLGAIIELLEHSK